MVSDLIPDTVPVPADHRSSDGNRRDQDDLESTVCSFRNFIPSFRGRLVCSGCRISLRVSHGSKNNGRSDQKSVHKCRRRNLSSFCNNTSPIFIMNFLVWKTLDRKELLLPSLVILLGTPVVMSFPFRKIYKSGRKRGGGRNTLGMQRNYIMKKKSVESCMMDSFETIVKVGGYLIIFSVLLELAEQTGQKNIAATLLLSTLEVTNGILMIAKRFPEISTAYPLLIGLTSMGGICSMAQTQSMIRGTGLKLSDYIIQKLATAMAASGFAILYAKFNF